MKNITGRQLLSCKEYGQTDKSLMFGTTTNTPNTGGFGGAGGAFGSQPSSSFGSSSSSSFGSTPSSTGFGTSFGSGFGTSTFGSAPATNSTGFGTGSSTGFGSFGSTPATSTATNSTGFGAGSSTGFGSFGSTPATSTASSNPSIGFGTSSFGFPSSTQPSTSFGTSGGFGSSGSTFGSTFGTTAPSTTTSSAFGTNSAAANKSFGGLGFGSVTPASGTSLTTPSFGKLGGFGTTPASTGFGSPSGGFGSLSSGFGSSGGFGTSTTTGSAFGGTTTGFGLGTTSGFGGSGLGTGTGIGTGTLGFGSTAANTGFMQGLGQPQQQQQPQQQVGNPVVQAFEKIQSCYASSRDWSTGRYLSTVEGKANEDCEFKAVMYNSKKNDVIPPAFTDSLLKGRLLEQAEQDNVDPENLVPVLEFGIAPLKNRFDRQVSTAAKTKDYLQSLSEILSTVETANTQVAIRFETLRRKQVAIYRTLLTIMRKIEVLRNRGQRLQPSELRYKERLETLFLRLKEPQLQLQSLSNSTALHENQRDSFGEIESGDDIDFLCSALQQQREGLEYVTDMLRKDIRDVNIMKAVMEAERGDAGARKYHVIN